LLHDKILSKFAKAYNQKVSEDRNMSSRFKRVESLLIEEHIERICG
jgi:hypothetical protein